MALHVLVSEGTLMDELGNPIAPALSAQQTIVLWASPKTSVGTWAATFTDSTEPFSLSSGAQDDSVSYDFVCAAGTYTLDFTHLIGPNRGIYRISIDGVVIGNVDGYRATYRFDSGTGTLAVPDMATITGLGLGAGAHVLKFTMSHQNASSSAFYGCISAAVFTRTA